MIIVVVVVVVVVLLLLLMIMMMIIMMIIIMIITLIMLLVIISVIILVVIIKMIQIQIMRGYAHVHARPDETRSLESLPVRCSGVWQDPISDYPRQRGKTTSSRSSLSLTILFFGGPRDVVVPPSVARRHETNDPSTKIAKTHKTQTHTI